MSRTGIQWTNHTWNPVTGCTKVSEGCRHCYAEGVAQRFWSEQYPAVLDAGRERPRRFTDVQVHDDRLDIPLRWQSPRRIFVNSMSDLFHDDVPDEFIVRVFLVMGTAMKHTFQVLTKRPERLREMVHTVLLDAFTHEGARWPLPNVHLGVSAEDQRTADERIPILLETPAAVRWVSAEPLLGPVDFTDLTVKRSGESVPEQWDSLRREWWDDIGADGPRLDWVVIGGESGAHARPCHVAWVRDIVRQCSDADVAVFVKQLGAHAVEEGCAPGHVLVGGNPASLHKLVHTKGGDIEEWPLDLQVRQWPTELV